MKTTAPGLCLLLLIACSTALHICAQQPLWVGVSSTNPVCIGYSNGTIQLFVTGGNPPYTFNWSNGIVSSSDMLNNLTAGNYSVTVTDADTSVVYEEVTLHDPDSIVLVYQTSGDTICYDQTVAIHITALPINQGPFWYNYESNTGSYSGDFYYTHPGANNFVITNAYGCSTSLAVNLPVCEGYTSVAGYIDNSPHILLYPNPVSNWLHVETPHPIDAVNIYTINGIIAASYTTANTTLNVSALPAGVYIAEVIIQHVPYRYKITRL